MVTRLYTHPICIEHDPGEMHPECPARLRSVMKALDDDAFDALDRVEAPLADTALLRLGHDPEYIDDVLARVPASGRTYLDPDTVLSPASGEAARRGVGAVCAAVDAVIGGEAQNAFCAIRPPGHHAEYAQAMGFCLFNNVSIGARHAQQAHGLGRVAVVDFDVHHGNGTQHSFYDDPTLFFGSSHQMPCYPGTGEESEIGADNTNCNTPLPPGAGSREFRNAWEREILPALQAFGPDMVIISAGFDAHERDPLADLRVQTEDYYWLTREIAKLADDMCDGRVVSSLEGGYDLRALGESAARHVRALMEA